MAIDKQWVSREPRKNIANGFVRILTKARREFDVLLLENISKSGFGMKGTNQLGVEIGDIVSTSFITDHSDGKCLDASIRYIVANEDLQHYGCKFTDSCSSDKK